MNHEINDPLSKMPKNLQDMISVDAKQRIVENQALQAAIYELSDLYALLKQDVTQLYEFGNQKESDQTWRRSVYRAVFSWIEGVVYQMKQVAICTQGGYYQAKFLRAETTFLEEESYSLQDNGKVKIKNNNFVEVDKNLRFAYLKIAEGFSLSTKLEVSQHDGWFQFRTAIKIRNRLTHPKNVQDMTVTDEDMEVLLNTLKWFEAQFAKLITDIRATVVPTLEKIKAEGRSNIQNITDKAMMTFARSTKVENVITLIDELELTSASSNKNEEKLEMMRVVLDELKKEIAGDLISTKG